jgi:hypothetical protein
MRRLKGMQQKKRKQNQQRIKLNREQEDERSVATEVE